MAFYNNTDDEKDKDNAQGMNSTEDTQSTSAAPVQLSNQSASVGSGSENTGTINNAAPKSTKAASSGTGPGFANYAKQNQGKAQESLNASVAKQVQNTGVGATNAINQATQQFNTKVDDGTLANRQNAVQDVSNTVNSARALTAGAAVDPSQSARFADVINAQYNGPESLRQSGLYNQTAKTVNSAQNTIDNTKTATGREELLKNMYNQRADYTAGLNKLDSALLNASQQGVQNVQNAAAAQGNLGQTLDKAQVQSATASQNRANEISDIRNQARDTFSTGKTAEETATDARLQGVVDNWEKLPQYFRDIITQGKGSANLNSLEAQLLGVGSGEGLYNLGANAIKSGVADKERLISKDEQLRQDALSKLAGLDASKLLSTNLKYSNADKAGTQSAQDALDLAGTREGLNQAEQGFQDYATDADLSATASKKNKTNGKRYYNTQEANLGDVLSNAGYNFGETGAGNNIGNADLLTAIIKAREGSQLNPAINGVGGAAEAMGDGLDVGGGTVASDAIDLYGSMGLNAITGALGLGTLSDTARTVMNKGADAVGTFDNFIGDTTGVNAITGALGLGKVGDKVTGAINGISKAVLGGGANTKASKSKAEQMAKDKLNAKVTDALQSQGFNNRVNVENTDTTTSRLSALQAILDGMDKTNIG